MRQLRYVYLVVMDAFYTFLADDGWAIASHIALSTLMALFPFLIVLTSLAPRRSDCRQPGNRAGLASAPFITRNLCHAIPLFGGGMSVRRSLRCEAESSRQSPASLLTRQLEGFAHVGATTRFEPAGR